MWPPGSKMTAMKPNGIIPHCKPCKNGAFKSERIKEENKNGMINELCNMIIGELDTGCVCFLIWSNVSCLGWIDNSVVCCFVLFLEFLMDSTLCDNFSHNKSTSVFENVFSDGHNACWFWNIFSLLDSTSTKILSSSITILERSIGIFPRMISLCRIPII